MKMLSNHEKNSLIELGQSIESKLEEKIKRSFLIHPFLPGYGLEGDYEYHMFNVKITFSLKSLRESIETYPEYDIAQEVANIFTENISKLVYSNLEKVLQSELNPFKTNNAESILKFLKMNKSAYLICSEADSITFEMHEEFKPYELNFMIPDDYPYLVGEIYGIPIYVNPLQEKRKVIAILKPILDYGIVVRKDGFSTYVVQDDDVAVDYEPVHLYFNIQSSTEDHKIFILEYDRD
jgi:hypothetical protein